MHTTTIQWGDGYLKVGPSFPDILLKKLKYWRRTLEWNEEQMRRISNGSYEELYSVRTWIDQNTQQLNQQLSTMPGFMHRVKSVLREAELPAYLNYLSEKGGEKARRLRQAYAHDRWPLVLAAMENDGEFQTRLPRWIDHYFAHDRTGSYLYEKKVLLTI